MQFINFFALIKQNKIASGVFLTNLFLNTNYVICESQFGNCVHPILFYGRRPPTQNTILPFLELEHFFTEIFNQLMAPFMREQDRGAPGWYTVWKNW